MRKKFVDSLTNFIIKNKDCDEIKIKTIRYGLEGLYSSITKLGTVTILVILTKSFFEFLCLFVAYLMLRKYSFGLHASKSSICWLVTIPIYVGGSLIIKHFDFNIYVSLIVWALAFISFILWAPADTPKRPLLRAKLRKQQKIKTCIICIIYLAIIILVHNKTVINAVTLALIIQSIMINPLIYKITNTQFNNYKLYPNKV